MRLLGHEGLGCKEKGSNKFLRSVEDKRDLFGKQQDKWIERKECGYIQLLETEKKYWKILHFSSKPKHSYFKCEEGTEWIKQIHIFKSVSLNLNIFNLSLIFGHLRVIFFTVIKVVSVYPSSIPTNNCYFFAQVLLYELEWTIY